ncbi:MAG TPA: histidine kinase [Nakamurella sp.]
MRWLPAGGIRDAALPAAIAVVGVIELLTLEDVNLPTGIGLEMIACGLLIWRKNNPLVFCTLAGVTVFLMPILGTPLDEPTIPIPISAVVCYSLARWAAGLQGLIGVAIVMLVVLLSIYVFGGDRPTGFGEVVFVVALMAPPYVLGRLTRRLAVQNDQLAEQSARLAAYQETIRAEAVAAERARIARELHDVIAHSVSAMVVQTSAAEDLVHTDPERAVRVLRAVASTGRQALSETGRLLQVIRDEHDELGLHPAPGLDRLPELVERFRDSGLRVDLELDGPLDRLPAGVDLSAYRIVQEALTNALKYATDRTAAVRLTSTPAALTIHTANQSTDGRTRQAAGTGLGLVGMAERVSVFGGQLQHGRTEDGRFELTATLPLAAPLAGELV